MVREEQAGVSDAVEQSRQTKGVIEQKKVLGELGRAVSPKRWG